MAPKKSKQSEEWNECLKCRRVVHKRDVVQHKDDCSSAHGYVLDSVLHALIAAPSIQTKGYGASRLAQVEYQCKADPPVCNRPYLASVNVATPKKKLIRRSATLSPFLLGYPHKCQETVLTAKLLGTNTGRSLASVSFFLCTHPLKCTLHLTSRAATAHNSYVKKFVPYTEETAPPKSIMESRCCHTLHTVINTSRLVTTIDHCVVYWQVSFGGWLKKSSLKSTWNNVYCFGRSFFPAHMKGEKNSLSINVL